jgi:tyrosine-protein phosphatase YwqE
MGFLSKIFGKKPKQSEPRDLSALVTDVHSHLIPGIDDGAKSLEESLQLIQGLQQMGYKKIITTPHIMYDYYRNDSEIILSGLERVREAVKLNKLDIEVDAAAEYYLDDHFEKLIANKDLLTFGKNLVLFELSFFEEPKLMDKLIFDMQLNGYKPVLAHPARYTYMHKDNFSRYHELFDKGVLFQVNLGSIAGNYGPEVSKAAQYLADNNMIALLGSDTHHIMHIQMFSVLKTNPLINRLLDEGQLLNSSL